MALLAIIISLVGTGVSIVEANILRDQQQLMLEEKEAAVWPYVSAGVQMSYDTSATTIVYRLKNEGVGPALIGDIQHKTGETTGVLTEILPSLREKFPDLQLIPTLSSSSTNKVLGAGESMVVFSLYVTQKPSAENDPIALASAIETTFCYCSIYGACWDFNGQQLAGTTNCGGRDFLQ